MTQEHPITPPPELYKQWESQPRSIAFEAAYKAGADMELEACVGYVDTHVSGNRARALREARRPKPPSLKELALQALEEVDDTFDINEVHHETIRRALEQLDD